MVLAVFHENAGVAGNGEDLFSLAERQILSVTHGFKTVAQLKTVERFPSFGLVTHDVHHAVDVLSQKRSTLSLSGPTGNVVTVMDNGVESTQENMDRVTIGIPPLAIIALKAAAMRERCMLNLSPYVQSVIQKAYDESAQDFISSLDSPSMAEPYFFKPNQSFEPK